METTATARIRPRKYQPIDVSTNECTDWSTPDRVRKVPNTASSKATMARATFQILNMPFFSCTIAECRKAVAASHGIRAAFSTGSQAQ